MITVDEFNILFTKPMMMGKTVICIISRLISSMRPIQNQIFLTNSLKINKKEYNMVNDMHIL